MNAVTVPMADADEVKEKFDDAPLDAVSQVDKLATEAEKADLGAVGQT